LITEVEENEILLNPLPSDPTEGLLLSNGAPSIHLAFTISCWFFNKRADVSGN